MIYSQHSWGVIGVIIQLHFGRDGIYLINETLQLQIHSSLLIA
jgi:hypothetical protein